MAQEFVRMTKISEEIKSGVKMGNELSNKIKPAVNCAAKTVKPIGRKN